MGFVAALTAAPAAAEDDGMSLMERGAQLFFEGLRQEMAPAIEEFEGLTDEIAPALRNFAQEMGPKLGALMDEVEDWSAYEAPEVLPNGDIIIRRKPDLPVEKPEEVAPPAEL